MENQQLFTIIVAVVLVASLVPSFVLLFSGKTAEEELSPKKYSSQNVPVVVTQLVNKMYLVGISNISEQELRETIESQEGVYGTLLSKKNVFLNQSSGITRLYNVTILLEEEADAARLEFKLKRRLSEKFETEIFMMRAAKVKALGNITGQIKEIGETSVFDPKEVSFKAEVFPATVGNETINVNLEFWALNKTVISGEATEPQKYYYPPTREEKTKLSTRVEKVHSDKIISANISAQDAGKLNETLLEKLGNGTVFFETKLSSSTKQEMGNESLKDPLVESFSKQNGSTKIIFGENATTWDVSSFFAKNGVEEYEINPLPLLVFYENVSEENLSKALKHLSFAENVSVENHLSLKGPSEAEFNGTLYELPEEPIDAWGNEQVGEEKTINAVVVIQYDEAVAVYAE